MKGNNVLKDKSTDDCVNFCLEKSCSDRKNRDFYLSIVKKLMRLNEQQNYWSGWYTSNKTVPTYPDYTQLYKLNDKQYFDDKQYKVTCNDCQTVSSGGITSEE